MSSISFFVPGLPKGQPRVRAFVRGRHAGVFDPGTADDWKACVMLAARAALSEMRPALMPVWTGPVEASLFYVFPRPKSHFTSKGALKPGSPLHHTAKPDRDNLDKAVLDTLTQAQMWKDDAQVCAGFTSKRYAAPGEGTGCHITIKPLDSAHS